MTGDQVTAKQAPQLMLASASPRRAELLRQLRLRFRQCSMDIDETPGAGEPARELVVRLARDKALAGRDRVPLSAGLPVLAADTLVSVEGCILGKPVDRADGLQMLARLSGQEHEVLTAIAVAGTEGVSTCLSVSRVWFRTLEPGEAERYWASGEPRDKAGGYGIQGLGGIFVTRLDGSYTGVMGLPLAETELLLRQAGVDCWAYREGPSAAMTAEAGQERSE